MLHLRRQNRPLEYFAHQLGGRLLAERGFGVPSGGEVQVDGCSTDFALPGAPGVGYSPSTSMRIPLLDGLDP